MLASLPMLLVLLAVPPVGAQVVSVTVLADFGDGTYLWADVTLPADNVTALKATELANATWDLVPVEVTWFDSQICLQSPCAFVNDLGDRNPVYPVYWHFYQWNTTAGAWDVASFGPSDTDLRNGDAIAWFLAVDDPATFASPRPVPTPRSRDVWTSFRGDLQNRGLARGAIPVTNVLLWDSNVGVKEIDTTPVVAYGMVFVATRNALVALDGRTGREVWRNPDVRSLLSTPAIYDGHLVLGGIDGKLHYVDALTGAEAWSLVLGPGARSTGVASSPAVFEGRAYVGTFNETAGGMGRVFAVNLNSGTIAWAFDAPGVIHMSQPAILGGNLYVGIMGVYDGDIGYDPPHGVLSLHLDGALNWFYRTDGPVASSPVLAADRIFVTAKDGYVYAIGFDGTQKWREQIGTSTSSPSLAGDILYVASSGIDGRGDLFAFTLDGAYRWSASPGGAVQTSPVSDGRLVCGATNVADGRYVCMVDGHLAWNYTPSPHQYILGSPVVVGDTMYAPSDNGHVYAFRDADPTAKPLLALRVQAPSFFLEGAAASVVFTAEGLGVGRAVDVALRVTIPAGYRLANESAKQATTPRTLTLSLEEVGPDRNATVEFVGTPLSGFQTFPFRAALSYADLAARPYPVVNVERELAISVKTPQPTIPAAFWVSLGLLSAAAVAAAGFFLWRRRRPGGDGDG